MGEIVLSGGGSTLVATDSMLAEIARMKDLDFSAHLWAGRARRLRLALEHGGAAVAEPAAELTVVAVELERAGGECRRLWSRLSEAAENYGRAERAVQGALESLGARVAHGLGRFWVFAAAGLAVTAAEGLAALTVLHVLTGTRGDAVTDVGAWVRAHRGALSDPRMVGLVRTMVSSVDNFAKGAAGVPFGWGRLLDDRVLGTFGTGGAAKMTIAALMFGGLLHPTPVRVAPVVSEPEPPPSGYGDLARRIPTGGPGTPQVRVERYVQPDGSSSWMVYIGGTLDTGFRPGDEPWDDTSNLRTFAGYDSASLSAVHEAMRQAGVGDGDPYMVAGFSQGGLVGEALAKGDPDCRGLVTFGSPTIPSADSEATRRVDVRFDEDLIPALSGLPSAPPGDHHTIVQTSAFDGAPAPTDTLLPAHDITRYARVADRMDASTDARLTGMRTTMLRMLDGAPAESTLYRADRVRAE